MRLLSTAWEEVKLPVAKNLAVSVAKQTVGTRFRVGAGILAVSGGLTVCGGIVVVAGGVDPESELGRAGHPLVLGVLMIAAGTLYLWAGGTALRRRRSARSLITAA